MARRQGVALPVHRAVLPALRGVRPVPARLHLLGLAARLGAASADAHVHRAGQLRASCWRTRTSGTRCVNTFGIFVLSTVPQLLLALVLAHAAQPAAARPHVLPDGRADPERHLGGRRRRSSSASSSAATSAWSTGCSAWSASSRSTGRRHSWSSWIAISTMVDWRWTGYNALIYLAAHAGDPAATSTRRPRSTAPRSGGSSGSITVPLLRPTIIFTVDHLDDRRHAALHRAAAVRQPAQHQRRQPRPVPDPDDVPVRARRSATTSSATAPRSPGCCS